MKKSIFHIAIAALMTAAATSMASAQATRTGYYTDGYSYRYMMNPAVGNESGFVAIPIIGNLNVRAGGNIGISDVLYNVNGKTATFMHPGVSASEVLGNLHDNNRIGADFNAPVIAVGFKGFGGYNTVTLSTKVSTEVKLPKSLFSLLKEGISNKSYNIGDIDAMARAYAEMAFGHSRDINKEWRVGATVKVIVGAGNVHLDMKESTLALGTDSWRITSEGQVNANIKGLQYKTKVNATTGNRYIDDVDIDGGGAAGIGVGLDLGAVYKPAFLPELTLSASLLDLGFIRWNTNMVASTQGRRTFDTDKYTFSVDDKAPNSFDNEFDKIKDDLCALYQLSDLGDQGGQTTGLGATLNIGALYTLPVYKAMSVGVLNTTRFNGDFTWTDFRLSANWAPCRVFDASLSLGAGTFGTGVGALLNLHCRKGINLFVGSDNILYKSSKDGFPLSRNSAVNFGFNITY